MKHEPVVEYFELVHLRAYSQADSNDAVEAFHQLTFPDKEKGFEDITLLRDIILDSDLCICIRWHGGIPGMGKSPLAFNWLLRFPGSARSIIPCG